MGLLSDPEYRSVKWVRVLKKIHGPLCFVLYVGALAWFVLLGNKEFNNETYFSENALLPGLVTTEFNGEHTAKQFFDELTNEIRYKLEDAEQMPVAWLVAKMSQLHLEVYTHNFTLDYPLGKGQVYHGTNVYGILRAPRTASLEALVLTAPHRAPGTHQKDTAAGIALMLAFAQFARSQKYWAKDIIFLVTEHEQLGMQAWLEAYHGIQRDSETFYTSLGGFWSPGMPSLDLGALGMGFEHKKCLNPGKLKGRSGSIQAAINLEIHTPKIKYIEVKVEGLNGQLPNLDLSNLVHKLCVKSGIHHSYKNSYSWIRNRNTVDEWTNGVYTLLGQVVTQIAGVPNGNHGLFHRFGIEAVTLEGRDASDPAGTPPKVNALTSANFYRLGMALESILRSLNNLLERFHQSYFFYMMAATNRFVSIGQYMPSLCLLCVAMLIRALSLWVTTQQDNEEEKSPKPKRKTSGADLPGDYKPEVPGDYKPEEIKSEGSTLRHRRVTESDDNECKESRELKEKFRTELGKEKSKKSGGKRRKEKEESSMSIVNIGANYLLVHLLGYAVMNSPILLSQIGAAYDYPSEFSVYYGLIAISVLLTLISPFFPRLLRKGHITHEELSLVNILLLVELATVCLSVGMHNYPLGLAMAVLYTPVALVIGVVTNGGGKKSGIALFLKRIFCLLLHPLSAVTLSMILYSSTLFPEEPWLGAAGRGRDAAMQAVMFSVADSLIYGNWLFNVASATILPIWIIFWQIVCNTVDAPA